MHICIFTESTHPNKKLKIIVGGIENQILQLLPAYEKIKDLEISIITRYSEYKPISNHLNIIQLHKFSIPILDIIYFYIKSIFKISKIHKIKYIDVLNIHTFSYNLISLFIIHLIIKIPILLKIPIDFSSHLNDIHLKKKQRIKSKLINFSWFILFKQIILHKIDFIRVLNKKMYKDLVNLAYPTENIITIPNGITSQNLVGIQKKIHNNTYFGYIGRLTEFKNLRFLLTVFKMHLSKYPYDKLYIYGKGPEETFILNFIFRNKLEENIVFKGFELNKKEIYSNIDVIIDPALGQGISNTILEAMCTKTFVIASNVEGNIDLINHKVTGLLFNPFSLQSLLKQLIYYKQNKAILQEILENAKRDALSKYDINIISKKIYELLKSNLKRA